MKNYLLPFLKKLTKPLIVIFLFLPPALACFYWYQIEYEEFHPFLSLEVKGWENISPETASATHDLTSAWYESTKSNFPVQFNKQGPVSDFDIFKSRISKSVTEKLGIFSYLPYHKVCLLNRNKAYLNGVIDEKQPLNVGGTAINQLDGYNFYAERGGEDCKSVSIGKFRQASSSPELGYSVAISISQEENNKRLRSDNYVVNLATTSVEAINTSVVISLKWWVMILTYFLLLFAWSFIFFQYEKILKFLYVLRGLKR